MTDKSGSLLRLDSILLLIDSLPLVNKWVSGKMKEENLGRIMFEFILLRSKLYAIKLYCEVIKN